MPVPALIPEISEVGITAAKPVHIVSRDADKIAGKPAGQEPHVTGHAQRAPCFFILLAVEEPAVCPMDVHGQVNRPGPP
ncbi:hypothetical protein D1872_286800 [compost metagenome]